MRTHATGAGSVRIALAAGIFTSAVVIVTAASAARPSKAPANVAPDEARQRLMQLELRRAPVAEVVPFLKHDAAAVRARAAVALGRLQDWTVAEALVELLADKDPAVRRAAAFALGELDPVMPLLVPQIKLGKKGDDPMVRGPALARAAAERKLDARLHLEERADVRRSLYAALGPLAIGAGLHHLELGLDPGTPDEAGWAARALGVHGHRRRDDATRNPEIMERLARLLTVAQDETRFGAVYALFRLGSKDVPRLLDRLGSDTDPRVRLYAARALGGKAGGETALAMAVRDPDWRVRVEAIRALAQAPRPRGLTDPNDVGTIAEAGLAALRTFAGTTDLVGARHAHVAMVAAEQLTKAPPALALPQLKAMAAEIGVGVASKPSVRKPAELWQLRCAVARAFDVLEGVPKLVLHCGESGEPAWRASVRAVDVLGSIGGGEGDKQRLLAAWLHHESPQVRLKAAEALSSLDRVRASDVPSLLAEQLAVESDAGAAGAMAEGLKQSGAAEQHKALRTALKRFSMVGGDGPEAVVAIVSALSAAHDTDAINVIRPLLTHASQRVRIAASQALLDLGSKPAGPSPARDPTFWPAAPESLPPRVTLKTSKGDIVLRLYRDDAPLTVTNFVKLARKGFYKNLTFHRVVSDFVVQGGDPRGDGSGGPGYTIPCEYNGRPYERGVVGMALNGKDSGGSQFFITHSPQPHLDGQYTAFAEVESGMDVVDAILPDDAILDVVVP